MKPLPVLLIVCALCASTRLVSAQVRVNSSNQRDTITCKGETVRVLGSKNDLVLSGNCPSVEVDGSDNVVRIEATDDIDVGGERNRVTWRRTIADIKRPRIRTVGPGNVVEQETTADQAADTGAAASRATPPPARPKAAPPAAAAPTTSARKPAASKPPVPPSESTTSRASTLSSAWIVEGKTIRLRGNNHRETLDCEERDVVIAGNNNTLTLRGRCTSLAIPGTSNVVAVEAIGRIAIQGDRNDVTWTRGTTAAAPQTSDFGRGNTIKKAP